MTTPQPTDVRWSPSENVLYVHPVDAPDRWVCQPAAPRRAASWAVPSLPADAVRLVPDETNNDALMAYAMKWQAERAAGIPRGAITAAESVTGNYLMNYDPANGDLHSLARAIVAEIAGALVVLPGDAPAVDGAGTATPAGHVAVEEPGVLWMAMRYALGRATYAVGEVGDAIERHADSLGPGQRQRMAAEIAAAIAGDRAGMDMDVVVWRRAVHRLVGEEPGRALLAGGEQP